MPAPYGDGLFNYEPPPANGLNITDIFHIVEPKPDDPGIKSVFDSKYSNVAIITHDATNQFGGMWAKEQLDLTLPFSTEMYLYLGHQYGKSGSIADGMTFTLHNDPAGINAIGGAGEGLGVYRGRKWTDSGQTTISHGTYLRNALVIEFDTYHNRQSEGAAVDDPGNDGSAHCSLVIPKSDVITTSDHKNVYKFTPANNWVRFQASWTPVGKGGKLDYSFDDNQMTYTVDNIMSTFDSTNVYWGFTGATEQLSSVQAVAMTRVPAQSINVEKTVKNAAGENIDQGVAFPGDTIRYTIRVTVRYLVSQIGPVIIRDTISEYLEYVAGYVTVTTKNRGSYEVMSAYSANYLTVSTDYSFTEITDWLEITFIARVKEDAGGKIIYNQALVDAEGLINPRYTNETKVTVFEDPTKEVSENSAAGIDDKPVMAGDIITYDIFYSNDGDTPVNITIEDKLPDGVDFESATDSGTYNGTAHTVTWALTNVAAQHEGKVSVVVVVNEKAVVKVENYATVKVGDNEVRTTNTVKNLVVPQDPEKEVSETSEAGKDGGVVKAGDKITYDITYLNYGETTATIVITDRLPDGVDFDSALDGGVYDAATHTVTWTLADVASGKDGIVSVVVIVNEKAVTQIENYATVRVGDHEPLITNKVVNLVTQPEKKVSETSEAGVGGSAVKAGDKITYSIFYLNYGETAATIVITDRLPDGVDFGSATDDGKYNAATHTVTWTLANIAGGSGGTVSVVVIVNKKATVKIGNYATVKVGDHDPQTTNNVENPLKGSSQCPSLKQVMKCRKIIKGRKIWDDNNNDKYTRPPNVEINLLRDGEVYRSITIDSAGNGVYIFSCLPIRKNSSHKYDYQVDEAVTPAGYTKKIEGYNIINTLIP